MRNLNIIAINATNDGSTPMYSAAIDAGQMVYVSAQAVFAVNTSAGPFKLQACNDLSTANNLPMDQVQTTWTDIPNTSQTVTAGAAVLIPNTQISYRWIRLAFLPSAGTGNVTAKLFAFTF